MSDTTRTRRAAIGLCVDCGLEPPRKGRRRCDVCADRHSGRQAERESILKAASAKRTRDARRAKGLCIDCGGNKEQSDRARCANCLERNRRWNVESDYAAHRKLLRSKVTPKEAIKIPAAVEIYGLLEAPAPPAEKPVYIFNRRDRAEQLNHLRRTG